MKDRITISGVLVPALPKNITICFAYHYDYGYYYQAMH